MKRKTYARSRAAILREAHKRWVATDREYRIDQKMSAAAAAALMKNIDKILHDPLIKITAPYPLASIPMREVEVGWCFGAGGPIAVVRRADIARFSTVLETYMEVKAGPGIYDWQMTRCFDGKRLTKAEVNAQRARCDSANISFLPHHPAVASAKQWVGVR